MKRLLFEEKILRVYTQNIDSLETQMRTGPRGSLRLEDKTVYLHGSIQTYRCTVGGHHTGLCTSDILASWKRGEKYECFECFPYSKFGRRISTGFLIPDIDLYNSLPPRSRTEEIKEFMTEDIPKADCLLVIGTSLRKDVIGARNLVHCTAESVRRTLGKCFWINLTPPPKDLESIFDYQLLDEADVVFTELFSLWKPCLKPFKLQVYEARTIMKSRSKSKILYAGMDSTTKSRVELRAKLRIKIRRNNKVI